MKKYFLFIFLFSLSFLGLSNYSFGQLLPSSTTQTCTNDADCSVGVEKCQIAPPMTNGTCVSIVTGNPTSSSSTSSTKCVGGTVNSLQHCECPTGTKNIDGVCTSCKADGVCCGISLNTSVPFIGKCIEDSSASVGADETGVTGETAFPVLMGSLTKMLVTIILIISFVLIIIGGIMIATGNPSGGKKMIINVVIGIALLGASGVILRLINPNFFG